MKKKYLKPEIKVNDKLNINLSILSTSGSFSKPGESKVREDIEEDIYTPFYSKD